MPTKPEQASPPSVGSGAFDAKQKSPVACATGLEFLPELRRSDRLSSRMT
jgi:hypothetical protein